MWLEFYALDIHTNIVLFCIMILMNKDNDHSERMQNVIMTKERAEK